MDALFVDDLGRVPTAEFRMVGKDSWMALNASSLVIPAEAMDYRMRRADDCHATGPTGIFLEMEWGLDMDWYDHDASWRPFIPLRPDDPGEEALSSSSLDWFFDCEMSMPWVQGIRGGFTIPEHTRSMIDTDLTNWSSCMDEIITNHPYPFDSSHPHPYDRGIIQRGFDTCEELQVAGGIARRTAMDYLGFFAWWTSLISQWEADLDTHTATEIKDLCLSRFRKRGVLVDLEQHWQEINIPNLLMHGVLVTYPWFPSLSMSPRFRCLAPCILQVYNEQRLLTGCEVHSTNFDNWADEFAIIRQYDHFFQEVADSG